MTKQPRSYDCIARDWIDRAVHGDDPTYNDQGHYGNRMYVSGAAIFSYGRHFEMARVLYEGKGRNRQPKMILINGERASVTTNKHQGCVRSAASRAGLPSCIIPYGALEAASIDIDSINVLHAEPDKWLTIDHVSANVPRWAEHIDCAEYVETDWSEEEIERWHVWAEAREYATKLGGLHAQIEGMRKRIAEGKEPYDWEPSYEEQIERKEAEVTKLIVEGVKVGRYNNWPRRVVPTGEQVKGWVHQHHRNVVSGVLPDGTPVKGVGQGTALHEPDDDGRWRWTTQRHILGESLIEADVNTTRRVTCSTCSGEGWHAEAPANLRSLDPHVYGDIDWRYVHRDDDVPVAATSRQVPVPYAGAGAGQRWNSYKEWHNLVEPVMGLFPLPAEHYTCRACSSRGWVTQPIKRRKVKFLSGFDHGEPHLAYFFCELPKCDASTVEDAYESLKPETVLLAEAMGRSVKRQGDIFAIETTATKKELLARSKRYGKRNVPKAITDQVESWLPPDSFAHEANDMAAASMLLGTNHQGTEVIHTNDGTIYARGCLWHVPDGRTNDHVRVKLGKAWHIIVKNTVPVRRG